MTLIKFAVQHLAHPARLARLAQLVQLAMVCSLLACAAVPAAAQGVSMLKPLQSSYTLLGFVYEPPKGEGWRELGMDPDAVRLVYAEQLGEEQINTRADFTAQSFPISTTEKVQLPDGPTLARLSMAQRMKEKQDQGAELVAFSQPQQLVGDLAIFEYTLVVKVDGEDAFEDYFVALAPDKSQYLAAKLVTKDKDFRDRAYFKGLQDSITVLKFPAAASSGERKAAGTAAPAPPVSN